MLVDEVITELAERTGRMQIRLTGHDLPEHVARRWLMIALTRFVHTLVITIADPAAPIVETLRAASQRLPDGVLEWTTGPELPAMLCRDRDMAS